MTKNAILLIPDIISMKYALESGLKKRGYELTSIDYRQVVKKNKLILKIYTVVHRKNKFKKQQQQVNEYFIKEYKRKNPDFVFIYNDETVLPSTIDYFKRNSKVIILLGDNPLTLNPQNIYNVSILFQADLVVCADSSWKNQLERIGLNNIIYDYLVYCPSVSFLKGDLSYKNRDKDILFIGRNYGSAWGYKRSLFLNEFTDFNIDIYGTGTHWGKWENDFPKIKEKLINTSHLSLNKYTELMHAYKIFPVDANPGIINGIHLRVFECISSGILPLIEYTKDIDLVFNGVPLPLIHNFSDSKQIASQYLKDDNGRIKILKDAKEFLNDNYSPEIVMRRLLNHIQ